MNNGSTFTVIAIVPAIVAAVTSLLYLVLPLKEPSGKQADLKQLALFAFVTSFLVVMMGLSGHVVRLGAP